MKFLLCLAMVLLTVNTSMADIFVPTQDWMQNHDRDRTNDVSIFIESVFNHFGLDKPTQILNCFCSENSQLFFRQLWVVKRLLEDSRDRKSFAAHADFIKLELLGTELMSTYSCIMMTQDFTDLLEALKIDHRDPEFFSMTLYFYYQAFYPRLADDIKPLIDTLKARDFSQAGDIFGGLLEHMVQEIRDDGFSFLALSGFWNGAAVELNVTFPQDSLQCHNNESADAVLKFLYKLAARVEQGGLREAPLSTLEFWSEEGKGILDSISDAVVDCSLNSQDLAILSDRLDIRVGSRAFGQALKRFITRRRLTYFAAEKGIKHSMEVHNFVHAGYTFGHMLDRLSQFLPYEEKLEALAQ